jgi:hypothetical protein
MRKAMRQSTAGGVDQAKAQTQPHSPTQSRPPQSQLPTELHSQTHTTTHQSHRRSQSHSQSLSQDATQEPTPTSTQQATPTSTQEFSQEAEAYNFRYKSPGLVVQSFEAAQGRMQRAKSVPLALEPPDAADEGVGPATTRLSPLSNAEVRKMRLAINDLTIRLTAFENMSFARGHDDCSDRYDQLDLRTADMDVRVREMERFVEDAQSARVNTSAMSIASVSTTATSSTAKPAEPEPTMAMMRERLDVLESRIITFQSCFPTASVPWEVEVIFVPFALKRLWMRLPDFRLEGGHDEWTQLSEASSMPANPLRAQSPACAGWAADQEHDSQWLLPRACHPHSISHDRLRSRGLVRCISVKSPDARSVRLAVDAALAPALAAMNMSDSARQPLRQTLSADPRVSQFLGLQQAWVPLRKLHRDSRLRFLTPSEMMTPALWDVPFLNTILMRTLSGRRLYVTQPEAYLQGHNFSEKLPGWSWLTLQSVAVDSLEMGASLASSEHRTEKEAWMHSDHLDACSLPPTPLQTQFPPRSRHVSMSPAPSMRKTAAVNALRERSASPMVHYSHTASAPTVPLAHKSSFKPPREPVCVPIPKPKARRDNMAQTRHWVRNASMPPIVQTQTSPTAKRRISLTNMAAPASRPSQSNKRRRTDSDERIRAPHVMPTPTPESQSQYRVGQEQQRHVSRAPAAPASPYIYTPHSNPIPTCEGSGDSDNTTQHSSGASTSSATEASQGGGDVGDDGDTGDADDNSLEDEGDHGGAEHASQDSTAWAGIESGSENGETVHADDDAAEQRMDFNDSDGESESGPSEYECKRGPPVRVKTEEATDGESDAGQHFFAGGFDSDNDLDID